MARSAGTFTTDTPEERARVARIARISGLRNVQKYGHAGLAARFPSDPLAPWERKVDPEGVLAPEDRRERAIAAKREQAMLAGIRSGEVRRKKRAGRRAWETRQLREAMPSADAD